MQVGMVELEVCCSAFNGCWQAQLAPVLNRRRTGTCRREASWSPIAPMTEASGIARNHVGLKRGSLKVDIECGSAARHRTAIGLCVPARSAQV